MGDVERKEKRFVVTIERTIIVYAWDAADAETRAADIVRSACYVQPTGGIKIIKVVEEKLLAKTSKSK
jgi:hypothetical protein